MTVKPNLYQHLRTAVHEIQVAMEIAQVNVMASEGPPFAILFPTERVAYGFLDTLMGTWPDGVARPTTENIREQRWRIGGADVLGVKFEQALICWPITTKPY